MSKKRLDIILVERQLVLSREKAQALILAGEVLVNDEPITKSGTFFSSDVNIRLRGEPSRFVSRGGEKLNSALEHFSLSPELRVCLDIGSSTGGFTDCLLQAGASHVYAVDVGSNQLDYKIRSDKRVSVFEKTHASSLSTINFHSPINFVVVDVSFISVTKIISYIREVIADGSDLLILIKPQFELEPHLIIKGGVLKNPEDSSIAIEKVRQSLYDNGFSEKGLVASALKGKKSENQEYFIWANYSSK